MNFVIILMTIYGFLTTVIIIIFHCRITSLEERQGLLEETIKALWGRSL